MYEDMMDRAFAGMKGDSRVDIVESFPVGAAGVAVGIVVGTDANGVLVAGPGTKPRGITVHDQLIRGEAYTQHDCANVMKNGMVYARVTAAGAVTDGGPVSYAANGTVANAGANLLAHATFRSGALTMSDGTVIALVEMADSLRVTAAA